MRSSRTARPSCTCATARGPKASGASSIGPRPSRAWRALRLPCCSSTSPISRGRRRFRPRTWTSCARRADGAPSTRARRPARTWRRRSASSRRRTSFESRRNSASRPQRPFPGSLMWRAACPPEPSRSSASVTRRRRARPVSARRSKPRPHGAGDPESQYAFWMMRLHPEWKVLNRGVDGQTAAEIRGRFKRDVVEARPAVAIVLAGVNDLFAGGEPEPIERDLGTMYADALDAGIVPVAASVLPYDRATPTATAAIFTLNHWIESFAKVLDIPFCDTHTAVGDPTAPHRLRGTPDGLHPDVDGYRRMGEALARTIGAHIARVPSR